ncbi:MAG: trypsin-like peptidase domain-containing protein [Elainella sp. C42_A2020_010]|nr:trypsin-like peptidase domain-containing protein [Elainella sp. C42_A2020_010]
MWRFNRFGFKDLAILLVGIGLGVIGTNWLGSRSYSSAPRSADGRLTAPRLVQNRNVLNLPSNRDAVVLAAVCVKTRMGQGEEACASGVSIDPQLVGIDPTKGAVVLTNYHVITDMGNRPPLQLAGKGEVYNAEIIRQSPEFDLALLLIPNVKFPIAALAETSPEQGTAVRAIGFPNNQPLTVKDSSLLGKTQECLAVAPCLALQQGTITFGNSGGPLEANGKVIGITQGEIVDEIAIPVEQIRQFLSGEDPPASRFPQFESGFPPMEEPPPYYPPPMYENYPPYPVW